MLKCTYLGLSLPIGMASSISNWALASRFSKPARRSLTFPRRDREAGVTRILEGVGEGGGGRRVREEGECASL